MTNDSLPRPRLAPLPPSPELADIFERYQRMMGFIPNSVSIMQRNPRMTRALSELSASVWDSSSLVGLGFKRLMALFASRVTGCQYCMAHTAGGALGLGVDEAKVAALWEYATSPHYSVAERCALDFTLAASSVPNAVTDEQFEAMRSHWSDDQIVEIVGVISLFGFTNRWNDTMATPLEAEPIAVGEALLADSGWSKQKHVRSDG